VLLRMQDADDPALLVMPDMFIPPAEKSGRILAVDRWVIGESVRLLSRSPELPPLAVNISGRSFEDPGLPEYIAGLLQEYRVSSSRLYLEVTETAAIGDMRHAQRFIDELRAIGCCICLDDFGAGFSSFAYLKHLKVDVIKIDGAFVRDLLHDHDSRGLVQSMVSMARSMSKRVVAECVENEETLEMLGNLGVDLAQGYLLDKPRAAQAWLAAFSCRPGPAVP
ncbi:MAG: EAL domain-containing protein, partial [Noviherbaspirillum sp.]